VFVTFASKIKFLCFNLIKQDKLILSQKLNIFSIHCAILVQFHPKLGKLDLFRVQNSIQLRINLAKKANQPFSLLTFSVWTSLGVLIIIKKSRETILR
jgi:hypothetical protein